MNNKILTLDLEGDGLSADINQQLFPEGNHQDPNTQIWCATIALRTEDNSLLTETIVSKLPNHTREVKDGIMTKAYHEDSTRIPDKIWANGDWHDRICKCRDEYELIINLLKELSHFQRQGYTIYCKGYGEYNYDYIALANSFMRLRNTNFDKLVETVGLKFHNTSTEFPELDKQWVETAKQVKTGEWKDNQKYMACGIKHNIEDAIQLLNLIPKYLNIKERTNNLNADFN